MMDMPLWIKNNPVHKFIFTVGYDNGFHDAMEVVKNEKQE